MVQYVLNVLQVITQIPNLNANHNAEIASEPKTNNAIMEILKDVLIVNNSKDIIVQTNYYRNLCVVSVGTILLRLVNNVMLKTAKDV